MNDQLKKTLNAIAKENKELLKKFDENIDSIPNLIMDEVKNLYLGKIVQSTNSKGVFYRINTINDITVNDCWTHYPAKKWSFIVDAVCDYYDRDNDNHLFGLTQVKSGITHTFYININCDLSGYKVVDESILNDMMIDKNSDLLKDMAGNTLYYYSRVSFIKDGYIINDGYVSAFDNETNMFEVTIHHGGYTHDKFQLKGSELRIIDR